MDRTTGADLKSEKLSAKKGIINQGSMEMPDITLKEIEFALKNTKNNKAPDQNSVVTDASKIRRRAFSSLKFL